LEVVSVLFFNTSHASYPNIEMVWLCGGVAFTKENAEW
jgi:hypothetical protein